MLSVFGTTQLVGQTVHPIVTLHETYMRVSFLALSDQSMDVAIVLDEGTVIEPYEERDGRTFWHLPYSAEGFNYVISDPETGEQTAHVYTHPKQKDPLYLTDELHDVLSDWQADGTRSLQSMLQPEEQSFTDHEALYLLQQFQYKGHGFIDGLHTVRMVTDAQDAGRDVVIIIINLPDTIVQVPRPDTADVRTDDKKDCEEWMDSDTCFCKIVLNIGANQQPFAKYSSGDYTPIHYFRRVQVNNRSNAKWNLWSKGPAVNWTLQNYIRNTGNTMQYDNSSFDNNNGPPNLDDAFSSPNWAAIRASFYCTYSCDALPRACDCEKPIQIDYDYDARMAVVARKRGSWGNPITQGARARVENYAILSVRDRNTREIELIDVGQGRLDATCHSGLNFNWWITAADVAFGIWASVNDITSDSSLSVEDGQAINAILGRLQTLLNTPFIINEGCQEPNFIRDLQLLDGIHNSVLRVGDSKDFYLHSIGSLGAHAYGIAEARAQLASNYHLLATIRGTENDRNCCMPNVAQYIMGAWDDRPNSGDDPDEEWYLSLQSIASKSSILGDVGSVIMGLSVQDEWRNWRRDPWNNGIILATDTDGDHTNYVPERCDQIIINPLSAMDEAISQVLEQKVLMDTPTVSTIEDAPDQSSDTSMKKEVPIAELDDISIYPNPTWGLLNLSFDHERYSHQLFSSMGQVVPTLNVTAKENQLDMRGLPDGLYYLAVIDRSSGQFHTFKIVKQ